jgi:hypothetical protein
MSEQAEEEVRLPPYARALAEAHADRGARCCPLEPGSDGEVTLTPLLGGIAPEPTAHDRAA